MSIENIGINIAKLRKEKGVTQEELARHMGVSGQAVSKWENGGVPDTELLPQIADYFAVSVDTLFGRSIADYSDIKTALAQKIIDTSSEEKMQTAYELCWVMQKALAGIMPEDEAGSLHSEGATRTYSTIQNDTGYTLMGLSKVLPYFLLAPEVSDKNLAYFEGIDYPSFFAMLSDKVVFDAILFFYKRERKHAFAPTIPFTPKLIIDNLNISIEKAQQVIDDLIKYQMIVINQIELDDGVKDVYQFTGFGSNFAAMLMFAREVIDKPRSWNIFHGGRSKPFLS